MFIQRHVNSKALTVNPSKKCKQLSRFLCKGRLVKGGRGVQKMLGMFTFLGS